MTIEMQVIHKQTEAERLRAYRLTKGDEYRRNDRDRKRTIRSLQTTEFVAIDGEGIGRGKNHRYVLLSAFNAEGEGEHYVAADKSRGIQWDEAFEFLYGQFLQKQRAAFVGFFLGYDFNQILSTLPVGAARSLLSFEGKALRKVVGKGRRQYNPVKVGDWEVDMMGFKRLSIRPRPDGCRCYEQRLKCHHKQNKWMHICDAGPFFQMSFLKVIELWKDALTQEEYDTILYGKNNLRTLSRWSPKLLPYNKLENIVLARIMSKLSDGFLRVGIKLTKDQWYGPGATAQQWLRNKGIPRKEQIRDKTNPLMPRWFRQVCHYSYYGGWFEIFSHGSILGTSYNYDINNAYPFASSKLPHLCGDCTYKRGKGSYGGNGAYVLLYATVYARGDRIGPVPYREKDGSILRPRVSKGWYWRFEVDAANRANLVEKVEEHEWAEFVPCNHPDPLSDIAGLYALRLEVGKNTPQGIAIKLNNNSLYGKFAQSTGSAPYNNWLYASYITAHCRAQILDAISSHPNKSNSVLMVATDGICFDSPHPSLPVSKKLGEWDATTYTDLCLFKPGVYWHKEGKDAILKVKSRGVPKEHFAGACKFAEREFWDYALLYMDNAIELNGKAYILKAQKVWPWFSVPVSFRMRTCKQALATGKWETAAEMMEEVNLVQDSNPHSKRTGAHWNKRKKRLDTIMRTLPKKDILTTYHGQEKPPPTKTLGFNMDGETALSTVIEAFATLRDRPANYDLPIEEYEWVTIHGG